MTVLFWMHVYTVTLLQGVTSKRICTCKEVYVHAFIRLSIELSQVTDIFNIIHVHDNVQKADCQLSALAAKALLFSAFHFSGSALSSFAT